MPLRRRDPAGRRRAGHRARHAHLPAAAAALTAVLVAAPAGARPARCTIAIVEPLSFGSYDPHSPLPNDSRGTIAVLCHGPVKTITVDVERPAGGLAMRSGAARLTYDVYLDPARTIPWGDGTRGTGRFGPTAPSDDPIPIYGRIPPRQPVPAGEYEDQLVMTVHF